MTIENIVGHEATVFYLTDWIHAVIAYTTFIDGQLAIAMESAGDIQLFHPWEVFIDGIPLGERSRDDRPIRD